MEIPVVLLAATEKVVIVGAVGYEEAFAFVSPRDKTVARETHIVTERSPWSQVFSRRREDDRNRISREIKEEGSELPEITTRRAAKVSLVLQTPAESAAFLRSNRSQ